MLPVRGEIRESPVTQPTESNPFPKNTARRQQVRHEANQPMKTNSYKTAPFAVLAALGLSVTPSQAQDNPNFAAGDLMLYFQKFGGTHTAMFNLGPAYVFRDATANLPNIITIGGTLTGATGSGGAGFPTAWYDDPTMFWGLAAVHDTSTSTITPGPNGDPSRTLYVSRVRNTLGTEGSATSAAWTVSANGSMTNAASSIETLNLRFNNGLNTMTTSLVESVAASPVDDPNQNPINISGVPTTAYQVFNGGVMGSFNTGTLGMFGGVETEGALDLFRILATTNVNAAPNPTGQLRAGSYEGSFVIDNAGSVSYVIAPVPEPATFALLGCGVIVGLARRRRAHRQ